MTIPARTIADIYKGRRQVEIFFRFSKQNLNITSFLGNSKNAVLSHVYVALIAYRLMACQKFQSKIGLACITWPAWCDEICFSNVKETTSSTSTDTIKDQ